MNGSGQHGSGQRSKKGFFSDGRLPVAKRYVYPSSRTVMLLVGGGGALLILIVFAFNLAAQQGTLISNGPLSSNHATFADDCQRCHTSFGDVSDEKCGVCHEKYGDEIGVHTFASHYLYRSGDFNRIGPRPDEPACFECHTEHVGRDNPITRVADDRCLACHPYGSFNKEHPQFDFAAEQTPDPANLKFPHTLHVNRVKKQEELVDLEQTCLYCHQAEPDGKNFTPINFEQHCDACHLTTSDATNWLDVVRPGATDTPGVLTLDAIRIQQAPGARWAVFANPNEFQNRSGQVRKTPLYHQDPWVLANLKRLRSILYDGGGLADLLDTSADVDPREARKLHEEALATLRDYAEALRAQPQQEVQDELKEVDRLLQEVTRRLRDPYAPLDETRFIVSGAAVNPALSEEQAQAYIRFIDRLTQPCQVCHYVENGTLLRAQADQDVLIRAEFNHRAHILDRRCLDCHAAIPIQQFASVSEGVEPERDNAGIQNIPEITTCQTCHTSRKASNTCVTCHLFHPDKSQHANLLLYLE